MINFATKKVLALLCYLVDMGEQESTRDKIMLTFWGESSQSQARYNLRYALWNINKLLRLDDALPDPLTASRTHCKFNADFPLRYDVQLFSAAAQPASGIETLASLESAYELYRGPFLEGFYLRDQSEWESWLFTRREELHERFINVAQELGNEHLRRGNPDKAIQVYLRLLSLSPELETAHEGLIRAYADQGKISAALRQYQAYVDIMKREFRAPPRQEMEQLAETLRQGRYQKTVLQPPPPIILQKSTQQTSDLPAVPITPPLPSMEAVNLESEEDGSEFVGRTAEMTTVQKLLNEVQQKRGHVLIISGEMGIGKSRLFRNILTVIPETFFVGIGEAHQIEASGPVETVMQILRQLEARPDLPDDIRNGLQAIYRERESISAEKLNGMDSPLLQMVRNWLLRLADFRPLIIAFDDMHWASPSLLKLFSALAYDVKKMPILLIGIFRTFESQGEDEIAQAIISIARTGRLCRLDLKSLTDEEAKQLLALRTRNLQREIDERTLGKLANFTAGVPLFIIEMTNFLHEGRLEILDHPVLNDEHDFSGAAGSILPDLMKRITTLRLAPLPEICRSVLKFAALLIGEFTLELIAELSRLESEVLEDALVELEYRNFLHHREESGRIVFSFNHQMIKIAIAEQIPDLERRRMFDQIVKSLKTIDAGITPEAMSFYLFQSGNRTEAIPYLTAAAGVWTGLGDSKRSLQFARLAYEVAVESMTDAPDLMVKVALAYNDKLIRNGMIKPAIDICTNVISILEQDQGGRHRGKMLDYRHELMQMLQTPAAEEIKSSKPLLALVSAKRALANIRLIQNDLDSAEKLIEESERLLDKLPDTPGNIREAGLLFQVKGRLNAAMGELTTAVILLENSIELLTSHGSIKELAAALLNLAEVHETIGNHKARLEALGRVKNLPRDVEACQEVISAYRQLAGLEMEDHNYEIAEDLLMRAIDYCGELGERSSSTAMAKIDLIGALTAQGDKESALKLYQEVKEQVNKFGGEEARKALSSLKPT